MDTQNAKPEFNPEKYKIALGTYRGKKVTCFFQKVKVTLAVVPIPQRLSVCFMRERIGLFKEQVFRN